MKLKGLNMSEREKTTLLIGLFAVLIVAFYFYMYQPTESRIAGLKSELAAVQAKLKAVQEITGNPGAFEAHMEANRAAIQTIETKLPSGENATGFIRSVEEKAKAANIKVIALKPGETVDKGQYLVYKYTVDIRGQYRDITRYCESLEKLPRLVNITGWKMTKGQDKALTATLLLEIYSAKGRPPIPEEKIRIPDQDRNPFV